MIIHSHKSAESIRVMICPRSRTDKLKRSRRAEALWRRLLSDETGGVPDLVAVFVVVTAIAGAVIGETLLACSRSALPPMGSDSEENTA